MKKTILIILTVLLSLGLFACGDSVNSYKANISELRTNYFLGSNESFNIEAVAGNKEIVFAIDGVSGEKSDFTLITVRPTAATVNKSYKYDVEINGTKVSGNLVAHPFDGSYSAEINSCAVGSALAINIIDGETASLITCEAKYSPDMITYQRAFAIAENKLKANIDSLKVGGKLNAEIYIRFLPNPIDSSGGYHWYVAFVDKDTNTYAALIDPMTEQVLAIRDGE